MKNCCLTGFLSLILFFAASHPGEAMEPLVTFLQNQAIPFDKAHDLTRLVEVAGDKTLVLLGEASHGTSEYYLWRKKLSRRLIEEKGFSFIVVEGDWPACYAVNRYVKGLDGEDAERLLREAFQRWPRWMWANRETLALVEWLRSYNLARPLEDRVGFYGMDVYSLETSAQIVKRELRQLEDKSLRHLAENYRCLERFQFDGSTYARALFRGDRNCRQQVEEVVSVLRERSGDFAGLDPKDFFNLKMNATAVKHAEAYYRSTVARGPDGWNSRVYAMENTLHRLLDYRGKGSQGIVWAHNTHVGDARATAMHQQNQVNIGQLTREKFGMENVFIVGFGAFEGSVVAGNSWGAPLEVMLVPAAGPGTVEALLSGVSHASFYYIFDPAWRERDDLAPPLGHRAIGVVYDPQTEHLGNFVPTVLPWRYDAFIFFQNTRALDPLGEE